MPMRCGSPVETMSPLLQKDGAVAEPLDGAHVVGDEDDGAVLVAQTIELVEALLLEGGVADREHLVDRAGCSASTWIITAKARPHEHARAVVLDLQRLELAQLGEVDDRCRSVCAPRGGEAEHRAVDQHVVARRQVVVEADAQLDERRQAPVDVDPARVDAVDAGHALQQRALARSVAADDPEELAVADVEGDVLERDELVEAAAAEGVERGLLERVDPLGRHAERLRDVVHGHGGRCASRRHHR